MVLTTAAGPRRSLLSARVRAVVASVSVEPAQSSFAAASAAGLPNSSSTSAGCPSGPASGVSPAGTQNFFMQAEQKKAIWPSSQPSCFRTLRTCTNIRLLTGFSGLAFAALGRRAALTAVPTAFATPTTVGSTSTPSPAAVQNSKPVHDLPPFAAEPAHDALLELPPAPIR